MIIDGILPKLSQIEFFKSDHNLMLRGEEIGSWKSKKLSTGDLRTSMTLSLVSYDGKRDNPTTTAFLWDMVILKRHFPTEM